ncbi:hypothetical protein [Hydrogenophaga sp.]|uniref:hypothetical protein n=1 Tax=Hydrogenophaga sp. TaxID=1904254 RepID=UPI00271A00EF|nr:hypothetical protein [Hydrogenophaga sp.]MDO8903891.1 hypothetical protein [Hydrogenophaga sp.]
MSLPSSPASRMIGTPASAWQNPFQTFLAESLSRQRALTVFALLMWAAMLPTLLAWGLDDRQLRGVNVWIKPLKFMASVGLFALCTAWFIGLLPPDRRTHRIIRIVVGMLIGAGLFEIGYITLQAGLGVGSHYNTSSAFHGVMYSLMGAGALVLTATQPLLAWQIARHARPEVPRVWRDAVVLGLVLTFVLGAGSGGLLGSVQPPSGAGLPILGWHFSGGDLRPAHFIGMHAQQWLPLAGLLLVHSTPRFARVALVAVTLLVVGVWLWALANGLDGAVFITPGIPR